MFKSWLTTWLLILVDEIYIQLKKKYEQGFGSSNRLDKWAKAEAFLNDTRQLEVMLFPFYYALTLPNLYYLVCWLKQRRFGPKFRQNYCPRMQNVYFPLTRVAQKRLCLNSPVRTIETTRRGFQTIFQCPNRYNSKLTDYFLFQMHPENVSPQFRSLEQQSRL